MKTDICLITVAITCTLCASTDIEVINTGNAQLIRSKKGRVVVSPNNWVGPQNSEFYCGPSVKARYNLNDGIDVAIKMVDSLNKPKTVGQVEIILSSMQKKCDVYLDYLPDHPTKSERKVMRDVQELVASKLVKKYGGTKKDVLSDVEPRARYYADVKSFTKAFVSFRYNAWLAGGYDRELGASDNKFKNRDIGLINRIKSRYTAEAKELWAIDGGKEVAKGATKAKRR